MPSSQPLPPKEKTLFNRILKCYEQKHYKNGLKFARQILSNPKFSEHGETLAMKGLTLNCTGKKEEAYELVKRGLKNDLKSHVCWHVYGLLQRSDKKYDEAIKCYRNALRWDKENLHILRDLSMLQVHMRDLEGYRDTRYNLLQLKPGQRASWIGYAISNHLLKDYMIAFKVLDEFAKTQQSDEALYEHSELLLYQGQILKEAGVHRQALNHLEENKSQIVDKLSYLEMKGELLILLEDYEAAEEICTELIYRNPENHSYFSMLETILKPSNEEEKLQIYRAISGIFPKADSPKLLPVIFTSGPSFRQLLSAYMRVQLHRGVPPLFTTFKPIYRDPHKIPIVDDVVRGFLSSLKKYEKFAEEDSEKEPPTTTLWTNFFFAQHLDAIGKQEEALEVLCEALEHTPTLIELHAVKAKVLKHLGDLPGAVACMDEAQSLDTADRFINCKCACYMIRNNMVKEADETAAKFTRENTSVDDYLREMQCLWYEVECAEAHLKAGRLGEALRKCYDVDKHFFEITEDQFDFHQYCVRKMTLRSYVRMLKCEDNIKSNRFFYRSARTAIKVYIQLHDEPYQSKKAPEAEVSSKSEARKNRNAQRKQDRKKSENKKRSEENSNKKRHLNHSNHSKADEEDETKKDQLDPEKLASVPDPLEQAQKFLVPLELNCGSLFGTHLLAFQLAERKGKVLVMLRSLLRAQKAATVNDEPEIHLCKIHLAKHVGSAKDLPQAVSDVLHHCAGSVYSAADVESINEDFLRKNTDSFPHLFSGAKAMYYLDNQRQGEALDLLLSFDKDTKGLTWKVCEEALQALKRKSIFGVVPQDFVQKLMQKCRDIFPRASAFVPREPTEAKKKKGGAKKAAEGDEKRSNGVVEHAENHELSVEGAANSKADLVRKNTPLDDPLKAEQVLENGTASVGEN